MNSSRVKKGKNDLYTTHPELVAEWNYSLNKISPDEVSKGSHESVYWICPKGHPSYLARIANRVYKNGGCPYCANRKILVGYNDLATVNPYLAEQWDYDRNYPKTPQEVFPKEGKNYYWICPLCHTSYSSSVSNRAAGKGCKKCSKQGTSFPEQAIFYYLKQIFPDAANRDTSLGVEFDIFIPSINTAVEYDGVRYHISEISLEKDNRKDALCLNNKITLYRFRDPQLPDTISAIRINCIDQRGNYIQDGIQDLLNHINSKCSIKVDISEDYFKILAFSAKNKKEKSILNTHPELSKEWHPSKNLPLTPDCITSGSGAHVWWACPDCGKEYRAYVYRRTSGTGCPRCAEKKRGIAKSKTAGQINNFLSQYPELAKEIILEEIADINIEELSAGTKTKLPWRCSTCGHEWRATIAHRTSKNGKNTGCPKCAQERTREAAKRAVRNIDTDTIYASLTEAAVSCNGDKRNIQKCCANSIKTAYGFHWEYVETSKHFVRPKNLIVKNITTGETFKTVTEAARKYGCDRTSISSALRGKTKTSQGCRWEYIDM